MIAMLAFFVKLIKTDLNEFAFCDSETEVVFCFTFVCVKALRPSQQCFSHVGTFSWVEQVLSNEDD